MRTRSFRALPGLFALLFILLFELAVPTPSHAATSWDRWTERLVQTLPFLSFFLPQGVEIDPFGAPTPGGTTSATSPNPGELRDEGIEIDPSGKVVPPPAP